MASRGYAKSDPKFAAQLFADVYEKGQSKLDASVVLKN